MGAVILYTLRESFHRRMAIVLLVLSLIVLGVFLWSVRFETQTDGRVMVILAGRTEGLAEKVVPTLLSQQLLFTGGPWLLVGIFAAAPLLTSFLEKGWAEMQFSKGIARWQIFLGRYLGALAMFACSVILLVGVPALYGWIGGGVMPGRIWVAAGIQLFNFAVLLGMMAAVSVAVPNQAIPVMLGFLQTIFSVVLRHREAGLYEVIQAKWAQWLIDWAYRILPKTAELGDVALAYVRAGTVDWWPLWSSGVFLIAVLGAGLWSLHRKSF